MAWFSATLAWFIKRRRTKLDVRLNSLHGGDASRTQGVWCSEPDALSYDICTKGPGNQSPEHRACCERDADLMLYHAIKSTEQYYHAINRYCHAINSTKQYYYHAINRYYHAINSTEHAQTAQRRRHAGTGSNSARQ